MTTFLLLISLLLNGVAIFSIILLFTRQNRFLEVEKKQENMIKEMEELISSYLFEMKEENEAFLSKFQATGTPILRATNPAANVNKTTLAEKTNQEVKMDNEPDSDWKEKAAGALKNQAVKAYQKSSRKEASSKETLSEQVSVKGMDTKAVHIGAEKTSPSSPDDIYRDLFVNQVMILQNQGLSIAEIAKKLNKGKTEIELLLKFSQSRQH
ncbi:hypothetical protein ACQYAD_05450 [Neobacillus sp. SM06]|uniref:hypothetical protein n=1 Tax=Neobacillus sp. SM06 TaxID=3422492 RepID=UPI003D2AC9E3